jgi:hypothetical protein
MRLKRSGRMRRHLWTALAFLVVAAATPINSFAQG